MDKETAWDEVIARLETIATIKKVYEGFVDISSIPDSHKPCIMVEPDITEVIEDNYDESGGNYALEQLNLVVWVLFVIWEKDKQVTGKGAIKGVFEWEKVIKDCLTANPKYLDNKVVKIRFGNITYLRNIGETTKGIVRLVQMDVELLMKYST